jgi:hypothetical protein
MVSRAARLESPPPMQHFSSRPAEDPVGFEEAATVP